MDIRIALAGNPNCGKTTMFNALTGSNQFVGNWPGVTVEKKEGRLKNREGVIITDLPGIYSLSPYTLEEVVARDYLVGEMPDAILDIVDGTNLERNLYLTTQLSELGIPVVIAINMMDVVRKNGDEIDTKVLEKRIGCPIIEISALKEEGIFEAVELAIEAARQGKRVPMHNFSGAVEHALAHIEEAVVHDLPSEQQRWYAVKLFERDERVLELLDLDRRTASHIEEDIRFAEFECDDDAESIIINERYNYITAILKDCYRRKNADGLTTSDKIDRVVTNRFAAIPIFAVIMFLVYFISISTVGAWASGWANDGVFGEGWHLLGIGSAAYHRAEDEFELAGSKAAAFEAEAQKAGVSLNEAASLIATAVKYNDAGGIAEEFPVTFADYQAAKAAEKPDPADYGIWIPGVPAILTSALEKVNCAPWLQALLLDGVVAGVGAVLGFVPQMLVLFLLLAFLEACGYMSRIAFVMDRIFRKFGLSGKSIIPLLVGTGCGVPGIMASRTIENERDRRMTIITTTFIPCGAKLPVIAMIAGAMFGGAWWVAPSAYFVGIVSVVLSGLILKKTRLFAGDPAPFVMELPAYHMPTLGNLLHSMWERGWSFIKKAGTIILLASVLIWFLSHFGFKDGVFGMVEEAESILATIGSAICGLFAPLGWGNWQGAVATITGLAAKENVVSTFGVLFSGAGGMDSVGAVWENIRALYSPLAGYSFLVFNLLCAPCAAAMGAIRREMNSAKWTLFAIGYQCVFAYGVSLLIYQLGMLFAGEGNLPGALAAFAVAALLIYLLFRKDNGGRKPAHKYSVK